MIYSRDDDLIDCEFLAEREFVNGFLKKFYEEIDSTDRLRNFSSSSTVDVSYRPPKPDAFNLHFNDVDVFGMRNLSYIKLSTDSDVPSELLPLMDYDDLKAQCEQKHQQTLRIIKDMNSDRDADRDNATEHLNRYGFRFHILLLR